MKISVDAGALCAKKNQRFGNYIVTENLIKALKLYDQENKYFFYSFCNKPQTINLQPKLFWSVFRISIEEIIKKKDYYLALNQALPLFTPSKIISFSHGLSFYFYPELYPDSAEKMKNQHKTMIERSHKIVVPSIKVKNELFAVFKKIKCEIIVIPYGIPFDMLSKIKDPLQGKQRSRSKDKFFLTVGMDHPIKNKKVLPRYKHKFIVANNVSRIKLKLLYQKANALVTTSLYESFNLPVLEALSLGCPVIGLKSAIIPELAPYVNLCQNKKELLYMLDQAEKNKLKIPDLK